MPRPEFFIHAIPQCMAVCLYVLLRHIAIQHMLLLLRQMDRYRIPLPFRLRLRFPLCTQNGLIPKRLAYGITCSVRIPNSEATPCLVNSRPASASFCIRSRSAIGISCPSNNASGSNPRRIERSAYSSGVLIDICRSLRICADVIRCPKTSDTTAAPNRSTSF